MDEQGFAPGFVGNAAVCRILGHALEAPAAAYALTGAPHLGKRMLAEAFVRALLGLAPGENWRTHPDVYALEAEEGKKQISVEQVRDLRERMSMRPLRAARTVAYVPAADSLNESGTNALLKVVEEPPAGAVFVLVAEDAGRLPATLRSRCVNLPLHPVPKADLVAALQARRMGKAQADALAEAARGRPGLAFAPQQVKSAATGLAISLITLNQGKRLKLIEDLAKACEAQDIPQLAWREALQTLMAETSDLLVREPKATVFGLGLPVVLRAVGSSVSPRIYLEALAMHLDGDLTEDARRLLPKHVSRGLSELFI